MSHNAQGSSCKSALLLRPQHIRQKSGCAITAKRVFAPASKEFCLRHICDASSAFYNFLPVLPNDHHGTKPRFCRINTPQNTFYNLSLVQVLTISVCIVSSIDSPLCFQSQSMAVAGPASHGQSRDPSLTLPERKENFDFLLSVFSSSPPSLHSLTSGSLPLSKDHS